MPARISPHSKHRQHDYHARHGSRSSALKPFLRRPYIYLFPALLLLYLYHTSHLPFSAHRPFPPNNLSPKYKNIDWSRYAYSQYATNSAYLCNAVMVFSSLHALGSRASRILFYPQEWDTEIASSKDRDSQLLVKARDELDVKLIPVAIPRPDNDAWNDSFVKFFAWGETQYERILHLDADITVLKPLDELFLLPSAPVAMLRAYWTLPQDRKLTSLFVLLEPSTSAFDRLLQAADPSRRKGGEYDMEILNTFYQDSAMVLPHRQYGLLTGEFRTTDHSNFLGSTSEEWDPQRVIDDASLVHFSDWPLPKPWIMWPHNLIGDVVPRCAGDGDASSAAVAAAAAAAVSKKPCKEREIWMGLYDDFRKRRKDVCALLSAPAPNWPPMNGSELGGEGEGS